MYHRKAIEELVDFISNRDGIADKNRLAAQVQQEFCLEKRRSVYYGNDFAIRFCSAASRSFSNTVLSLSALSQYDFIPFIVCVVTPIKNYLLLANTTFLKKISHSSQELRHDNIKGSFNGGDIMREFSGFENTPANFESLFHLHENHSFEENLDRLIEANDHISPTGKRFQPTPSQIECIQESVHRAISFFYSTEYKILNRDLRERVHAVEQEIAIAASIENVNLRGRIIEYLITADAGQRQALSNCLHTGQPLPQIFTADRLGDYECRVGRFLTATDIKAKVLCLSGNPKGYNIDKLLSFLAEEGSVYLIYIIAIDKNGGIQTRLCSVFHEQLLSGTRIIRHWAGRNSRGVTQYEGRALEALIDDFDDSIDVDSSQAFLTRCLDS